MINIAQSIQAKLKQLSQAKNRNHQQTLTRYFQERLLFRLSVSKYKNNFFLKGGALIYALEKEVSRPTLDLDLLAKKIKSDTKIVQEIFKTVCSITFPEDGVLFDAEKIEASEIVKDGRYSGIRVKLTASLGQIKQRMQIDIGFGDVIVPAPVEMNYPTLLEMEIPVIYAYSVESLISEKFEAMIDLSELNSRMKDFYDVFRILQKGDFDKDNLQIAITQTCKNRGTILPENHPLFTKEFAGDNTRNIQWKAFLKKANLDQSISFEEVMDLIGKELKPIYKEIQLTQ